MTRPTSVTSKSTRSAETSTSSAKPVRVRATKGVKKVEEYLDSKLEVEAIKRALAEGNKDEEASLRLSFYNASIRMKLAYAALTGGDLARARRLMAERATSAVTNTV